MYSKVKTVYLFNLWFCLQFFCNYAVDIQFIIGENIVTLDENIAKVSGKICALRSQLEEPLPLNISMKNWDTIVPLMKLVYEKKEDQLVQGIKEKTRSYMIDQIDLINTARYLNLPSIFDIAKNDLANTITKTLNSLSSYDIKTIREKLSNDIVHEIKITSYDTNFLVKKTINIGENQIINIIMWSPDNSKLMALSGTFMFIVESTGRVKKIPIQGKILAAIWQSNNVVQLAFSDGALDSFTLDSNKTTPLDFRLNANYSLAAWSKDGNKIAFAKEKESKLVTIDLPTKTLDYSKELKSKEGIIALDWSVDGSELSALSQKKLKVWSNDKFLFEDDAANYVYSVVKWSPVGKKIAVGYSKGIQIISLKSEGTRETQKITQIGQPDALAWLQNGSKILLGYPDYASIIDLEAKSIKEVIRFEDLHKVASVAGSPNGTKIALGFSEGIQIWHTTVSLSDLLMLLDLKQALSKYDHNNLITLLKQISNYWGLFDDIRKQAEQKNDQEILEILKEKEGIHVPEIVEEPLKSIKPKKQQLQEPTRQIMEIIPTKKKLHERLLEAAEKGDIEVVTTLLEQNINVNAEDIKGNTALMFASSNGHTAIVKLLIAAGAKINEKNNQNLTALIFAVEKGHETIVQFLLEKGAHINQRTMQGLTALIVAASYGYTQIVQLLLNNATTIIDAQTNEGTTALMAATTKGHKNIVDMLLGRGANRYLKNKAGRSAVDLAQTEIATATSEQIKCTYQEILNALTSTQELIKLTEKRLLLASGQGHLKALKALLEQNVNVDAKNIIGNTPLINAAERGYVEIVIVLLEKGANINARNNKGNTALMAAALRYQKGVVRLLIAKGADINLRNKQGKSALDIVEEEKSKSGSEQIKSIYQEIENILKSAMPQEPLAYREIIPERKKQTRELIQAARDGNFETVKSLLEKNFDVNEKNTSGNTALMVAAENGHEAIVALLIAKGADINLKNNENKSALDIAQDWLSKASLHFIKSNYQSIVNLFRQAEAQNLIVNARKGNVEEVKALLAQNIDVNKKDIYGATALILAAQNGHREIVQLLLAQGAHINEKAINGLTALIIAARNGHSEIAQLLFANGADINEKTKRGSTALTFAAEKGHEKIVKFLVENGAQINQKTVDGSTALDLAAQYGHEGIVQQLLLRNDIEVNSQTNRGYTALMFAAERGHEKVVELLLNKNANVELRSNEGSTALMFACASGFVGIVKKLIGNGAVVDRQNNDGWTALMYAAVNGHIDVVQTLLDNDAHIGIKNIYDSTVLDMVNAKLQKQQEPEMQERLQKVKRLLQEGSPITKKTKLEKE